MLLKPTCLYCFTVLHFYKWPDLITASQTVAKLFTNSFTKLFITLILCSYLLIYLFIYLLFIYLLFYLFIIFIYIYLLTIIIIQKLNETTYQFSFLCRTNFFSIPFYGLASLCLFVLEWEKHRNKFLCACSYGQGYMDVDQGCQVPKNTIFFMIEKRPRKGQIAKSFYF